MIKKLCTLSLLFTGGLSLAQTGNYVFSGAEMASYGPTDLATPGPQTWTTDRGATPGYFSAVGSATYTGAADNANVNGYVKYYANNAPAASFTFPVGTGADLRSLDISGAIPATAVVAAAWIAGDPGTGGDPTAPNAGTHPTTALGPGILSVSAAGMWDWQDIGGNAAGLTVTASIPNATTAAAANLRLVGWNGTQWIDLSTTQGSAAATGNTENSTLTGTMQAGITAIGIGATDITLPVTLLRFTAEWQQANNVLLRWAVAEEKDFARYEVEYAWDATRFATIGNMPGGHSDGLYSMPYVQPDRVAYYRLKMVDIDGRFSYSKVAKVVLDDRSEAFSLFPNPVVNTATVKGTLSGDELRLYTPDGRLLKTVTATGAITAMELQPFAGGLYLLRVLRGSQSIYQVKLMKK